MLVKNVHIHNREGLWQILIEEGKISRIFSQDELCKTISLLLQCTPILIAQ